MPNFEQRGFEKILQNVAKGILIRGEKWGVNKSVRDAVGEVRKNVPTLQTAPQDVPQPRRDQKGHGAPQSDSETLSDLKRRFKALKDRNKSLARMLEQAMDELWKQQKEIATTKPADDDSVKDFTMAIAKVQLAQVFLDDSSLPLPVEEDTSMRAEVDDTDPRRRERVTDVGSTARSASDRQGQRQSKATPPDKDGPKRSAQKQRSDVEEQAHPSLEKSSFSWMLGQNDSGPGNVWPPLTTGHDIKRGDHSITKKNVGFLFGDEEADATGRGNSISKDLGQSGDDDEVTGAFKLGTLKGQKRY